MKLKYLIKAVAVYGVSKVIKRIISRELPSTEATWRCLQPSYAQLGEDLLILAILSQIKCTDAAYYVDVGAYDPFRFSNTYRLYQQGWRGINIDPNPNNISKFRMERREDINLELALMCKTGEAEFLFYESGTTGRLAECAGDGKSVLGEISCSRSIVKVDTLCSVLSRYAPDDLDFGLLSVDCEGADLEVLKSNDWNIFRPWIIAIEDHDYKQNSVIAEFLSSNGYMICAQALITKIFCRKDLIA